MNEFDQYAGLSGAQKKTFHAKRSGQAAKNRGLAKIGYHDPINPVFQEGPGPIEPLGNMPRGGQLSPTGDLGELRQLEALKVFPALQKMTDHVKRASHKIRLKEPFAK